MDCRKPRVARFPGRTRPSMRTDNRQPIGAVVAPSGVLLSPGQRVAVLGYDRWHGLPGWGSSLISGCILRIRHAVIFR